MRVHFYHNFRAYGGEFQDKTKIDDPLATRRKESDNLATTKCIFLIPTDGALEGLDLGLQEDFAKHHLGKYTLGPRFRWNGHGSSAQHVLTNKPDKSTAV